MIDSFRATYIAEFCRRHGIYLHSSTSGRNASWREEAEHFENNQGEMSTKMRLMISRD